MVHVKIKDLIAFIEWDDPHSSVNVLSEKSLSEFSKVLGELPKSVQAVILISKKPSVFIAGADLKEIQTLKTKEEFSEKIKQAHKILLKMENSSRTFISAIHGACLGGGTELALACDYRIASLHSSTNIGLPEVQLGFIPGFGGTVRLPRLIGFIKALDLILTGKTISAKKAHKLGLVDEIEGIPSLLEESAEKLARSILKGKKPRKRKIVTPNLPSFLRAFIVFITKRGILKKTKGFYPAPLKALRLIHKTYAWPLEKALAEEEKVFCELAVTEISRNLIRLFFMTEEIKKQTGSKDSKKFPPMSRIAVLGAGVMGSGIAYVSADKGFETRLFDLKKDQLLKGRNQAHSLWKKQLNRRKIDKFEKEMRQSRMSYSLDGKGFETMDLMIEAVVENMDVKKQVIETWSKRLKEEAIFASNTSSLSVTKMSKFYKNPSRFIGLHFFNPVYKMPLVEIIKGDQTSDETTARVFQFTKKLGKKPVIVKDSPGFLVNRLLMPWLTESLYLFEEGLSIRAIDQTFLKWGFPMGPFRLMDEVGLDVCVQVIKSFIDQGLKLSVPSFIDKLVMNEALGKKTGLGFYHYTSQGQARAVNKAMESLIDVQQGSSLKTEESLRRGLYRMINECIFVLEEEVVSRPETIDFAMIMGAGFPPFYGGPLRYAEQEGLSSILKDLETWCEEGLSRFKPADLLTKLVSDNQSFYKKTLERRE